jgi:antitoxin YefM
MQTANYTGLRNNLKAYIDSVIDDSDTVIVNRGRDTGIVLMSLSEYNSLKEMEYIMSSHVMVARLKEAENEMHEGKGKVISTEDLWK